MKWCHQSIRQLKMGWGFCVGRIKKFSFSLPLVLSQKHWRMQRFFRKWQLEWPKCSFAIYYWVFENGKLYKLVTWRTLHSTSLLACLFTIKMYFKIIRFFHDIFSLLICQKSLLCSIINNSHIMWHWSVDEVSYIVTTSDLKCVVHTVH